MASDHTLLDYVLRFADTDLILAQRLGQWVGHGPVLEEDIALTNVGLDLLGQARLWFAYASEIDVREPRNEGEATRRSEDAFAFLRESGGFRNLLLAEQPNGNYADTTARQFYFDAWHELALRELVGSRDPRIAEIAAKALKEVRYHAERSADWVIRLGDGTELSRRRMQSAIDDLWMFTGEMFAGDETEITLVAEGIAADVSALLAPWRERVAAVLEEGTLTMPSAQWMQRGGKQGVHTEHLSHLLAEMQSLHRAHPGAQW
jgi:ring-1,2-phenylacetyl-CoA epoxidase subunit PaaC